MQTTNIHVLVPVFPAGIKMGCSRNRGFKQHWREDDAMEFRQPVNTRKNFLITLFMWKTTIFLLFSRAWMKFQGLLITGRWAQMDILANSTINVRVNRKSNFCSPGTRQQAELKNILMIVDRRQVWLTCSFIFHSCRSSSGLRWSSYSSQAAQTSPSKTSPPPAKT